jgi:hypothetical protein
MSTLKTTNLQNASAASPAIVLAADGSATAQVSSLNGGPIAGARNRIINGDMRIDQRNAGASVTPSAIASNIYFIDRWFYTPSQASKVTLQRSTIAPNSTYSNSLSATVAAAVTPGASDYFGIAQKIEGFNLSDLAFGAATAQTFSFSFWVRSSVTGTYSVQFQNSAQDRSWIGTYSINAANTWEFKTLTVTGSTTGTWLTDNGAGIVAWFDLGSGSNFNGTPNQWNNSNTIRTSGSVNWISNAGATFYITGVQLEPGTVATPFERRIYGQELALCQRYFIKLVEPSLSAYGPSGTAVWRMGGVLPVQMRSSGTISFTGNPPIQSAGATTISGVAANYSNNGNSIEFDTTANTSITIGGSIVKTICSVSNTAINISAEL